MNKYELAIYNIETFKNAKIMIGKSIKDLYELVEHATPKKPIIIEREGYSYDNGDNIDHQPSISFNDYMCPNCKQIVLKHNCCRNNGCRQALDWSDNK